MNIKQVPAHGNNFSVGRSGKTPNKVILHWIVGNLASADATFQSGTRGASAHYGIEDDKVHQYVNEKDTAWHASNFTVNQESVGIEHSGGELITSTDRRKPSEQTHKTSAKLVSEICSRYSIPIDDKHILPHNKFSNTQCPGTLDIPLIIKLAKEQDGIIPPMEPISDNDVIIDFGDFRTDEEKYGKISLSTLKSKLLAKDIFITNAKRNEKTSNEKIKVLEKALEETINQFLDLEQKNNKLQEDYDKLNKKKLGEPLFVVFGYRVYSPLV